MFETNLLLNYCWFTVDNSHFKNLKMSGQMGNFQDTEFQDISVYKKISGISGNSGPCSCLDHKQTICTSLQTYNHASTWSLKFFYKPDAVTDAQPTVSKHVNQHKSKPSDSQKPRWTTRLFASLKFHSSYINTSIDMPNNVYCTLYTSYNIQRCSYIAAAAFNSIL